LQLAPFAFFAQWVGFNILGPLQNQLNSMAIEKTDTRRRGMAIGLGLGTASLLAAQSAEAAQQVADLAASDNRLGILALLAVPALGWVGFNILGPLQNQLDAMKK
jgi:photosystem II PsbY protein